MEKYNVYISGKITGLNIDEAFAKFEKAEEKALEMFNRRQKSNIHSQKYEYSIINPMKLEHVKDATWEVYMAKDIAELLKCKAIIMLPCWKESKGAKVEHAIAVELGLTIYYV